MHELSIVLALLQEVDAVATANGAAAVRRVTVQVGPLSGVDPGLLASAFEAVRRSALSAEAELVVETLNIRVRCRECCHESFVTPNRLLCGQCGGYRTTLLTGDELLLRRVELAPHKASGPLNGDARISNV